MDPFDCRRTEERWSNAVSDAPDAPEVVEAPPHHLIYQYGQMVIVFLFFTFFGTLSNIIKSFTPNLLMQKKSKQSNNKKLK